MSFLRYLLISRKSLIEHKLRSFLTILGIIFGVSAVIAMTAIGEGAKEEALRQIEQMGITNIFAYDRREARRSAAEKGKYVAGGLDERDLDFVVRTIPAITDWTAVQEKELFVQTRGFQSKLPVKGVEPGFFRTLSHQTAHGRMLTDMDLLQSHKVCVLGHDLEARLFQRTRALGSHVRLNGTDFLVVGLLSDHPGHNGDLYIPFTAPVLTEHVEQFEAPVSLAIFQVPDVPLIPTVATLIERILVRRHMGVQDVELVVPEALFRQQARTRNIFNSIMILITGISLLVGGIGIMNIMLASVLERTKEIGIRRGVGATKRDIRLQFLAEAVVLTSAGGVIGILVGVLLTQVVAGVTGWQTRIPILAVLIAFSFSVLIGVIFGYFPAKNAGEMDPIEALRYE